MSTTARLLRNIVRLWVALLPSVVAVSVTPPLWNHGSSAAFDLMGAMWVVCVVWFFSIWRAFKVEPAKKEAT